MPKALKKGKFWHRLFGHDHMLLAAYGPAAITFYCEGADCGGFVTIKTARDYAGRLKAGLAGWDGGRPDDMMIDTPDGYMSEGERKRLLQRRRQEVGD